MPKPVCVKCAAFMRPEKNGFDFIEGKPSGDRLDWNVTPRKREHWEPYKVWRGDKWKCRFCGYEIIIGALAAVSQDYEPGFPKWVEHVRATTKLEVNDC